APVAMLSYYAKSACWLPLPRVDSDGAEPNSAVIRLPRTWRAGGVSPLFSVRLSWLAGSTGGLAVSRVTVPRGHRGVGAVFLPKWQPGQRRGHSDNADKSCQLVRVVRVRKPLIC